MLAVSTSVWWTIGFAVAGVVVLLVALLLLAIIALARRIARQAADITEALEATRRNTEPLFDIAAVNHALDRITRGLARLRVGEAGEEPDANPGMLGRIVDRFSPGTESP